MLGLGKTGVVRSCTSVSSAPGRESVIYHRYAVGLYRQALLTHGSRYRLAEWASTVLGICSHGKKAALLRSALTGSQPSTPPADGSGLGAPAAGGR
jgi:hypothetical protein